MIDGVMIKEITVQNPKHDKEVKGPNGQSASAENKKKQKKFCPLL